jgi:hypothetical protein
MCSVFRPWFNCLKFSSLNRIFCAIILHSVFWHFCYSYFTRTIPMNILDTQGQ